MAAEQKRSPRDIAAGLDRQARFLGVAAMVFGALVIAGSAYLFFATELASLGSLACFATLGLLALLAGYQKLRAGHHPTED